MIDRRLKVCITPPDGPQICRTHPDAKVGSGVVIDKTPTHFDVLTAAHLCEDHVGKVAKSKNVNGMLIEAEGVTTLSVKDYSGYRFEASKAEIVKMDQGENVDLCLVRVHENTDDLSIAPVRLATTLPKYGDTIVNMAAPHGIRYDSAPLMFQGIFSGSPDDENVYLVTSYTRPGSSGSGVFTVAGKLFGMIHEYVPQLEHGVGRAVTLPTIRQFLCKNVVPTSKPRFHCGVSQ